jgi:two-component system response regulator FixJ
MFLDRSNPDGDGCLVVDRSLIKLERLLHDLSCRGPYLPVIVVSADIRTADTVRAIKEGAETVLQKPYDESELREALQSVMKIGKRLRLVCGPCRNAAAQIDTLSPVERSVVNLLIAGKPNKAIARSLNVSIRTVEDRRHKIMAKLGIGSLAELIRVVVTAGTDVSENTL